MLRSLILILSIGLFSCSLQATQLQNLNDILQPQQMREDLNQWLDFLDKTHPDLSYTVANTELFHSRINQLKKSLNKPMTALQFWREISVLNSQLSDGHTGIAISKRRQLAQQHIDNGGGLFPFSLVIADGRLIIRSLIDGQESKLKGYSIEKINGLAIDDVVQPLLKRLHGDSLRQRQAILARRFATYYWLYFGHADTFIIDVKDHDKAIKINDISITASKAEFNIEQSFAQTYQFKVLDNETAQLTINKFYWSDKSRYFKFMEESFKQLKALNIKKLIIDIRENGGGDDDMWKQGIVSYIADKPWRHASTYKVKILAGRADEGETVGDVVPGELEENNLVKSDNPYKFNGDVYVLIGAYTYSSSILFATTVQDYGFASLVGESTGGKSGQTGGLQRLILANSQLLVFSPRFLLTRPNGDNNITPVMPNIELTYDKIQPEQLVKNLMQTW